MLGVSVSHVSLIKQEGGVIAPISQRRKLRLRKGGSPSQGHPTKKQSVDSNPALLDVKAPDQIATLFVLDTLGSPGPTPKEICGAAKKEPWPCNTLVAMAGDHARPFPHTEG